MSTASLVDSIVAVKAFTIPYWSFLLESTFGSESLKVAAKALRLPMDLRYVGHFCFMCPNP